MKKLIAIPGKGVFASTENGTSIEDGRNLSSVTYPKLLQQLTSHVEQQAQSEYGFVVSAYIDNVNKTVSFTAGKDHRTLSNSSGKQFISRLNVSFDELSEEDLSDPDYFDNCVYSIVNDLANANSDDVIIGPDF